MNLDLNRRFVTLCTCVIVAACGGGGGSAGAPTVTPPPPPAPPPTPNVGPTVGVSLSPEPYNEGESFIIDARSSSDTDGEIVSIEVDQIVGGATDLLATQINVDTNPLGVIELVVPEVFVDTSIVMDVVVTDDDGAQAKETLLVTYTNTITEPKIDGFGDPYFETTTAMPLRLLGKTIGNILAVEATNSPVPDSQPVIVVAEEFRLIAERVIEPTALVLDEIQSGGKLFPSALGFNLEPSSPFQLVFVEEEANAVSWFAGFNLDEPVEYQRIQSIDIEQPCHIQGRVSTAQDFVWVGQRDGGLSVVQIDPIALMDLPPDTPNQQWTRDFDSSVISRAGGQRSLCFTFATTLPDRLSNPASQSNLSDLITIDFDANELVLMADNEGDDATYEIVEVIPLDTGGASDMSIVDVNGVGTPSLLPRFLVILMSDGRDQGNHQVLVVEQDDSTSEITQTRYPLQGAVPTQMIAAGSLFGPGDRLIDFGIDLVILTPTENTAIVLEDERADLGLFLGPPIYRPAQLLDIGIGAESGISVTGEFGGDFRSGFMVSYPDTSGSKIWVYRD